MPGGRTSQMQACALRAHMCVRTRICCAHRDTAIKWCFLLVEVQVIPEGCKRLHMPTNFVYIVSTY